MKHMIFALLLLTGITACNKDAGNNTSSTKGTANVTVVRFSDQTPLNHALVSITSSGVTITTAYTNSAGFVSIANLAPGNYEAVGFWAGDTTTSADDLIAYDALGHPGFQLSAGQTVNVTAQLK